VIKLTINTHVATVVFDRPPVNAIDHSWVEDMNQILDQVEAKQDIAVLHIRSAHKTFCAGADLALMRELVDTPEGCDAMVELIRKVQNVLDRLERIGVISVAEIAGAALGGGFEIALACDLRAAATTAKIGLPEASLGLLPGAGGTQRLPRVCGDAIARRIILGAEVITGEEAAKHGMVHWAIPGEQLTRWTQDLVTRLGLLPRQALAACKRCLEANYDESTDGFALELQETRELYGDADTQRRLQEFLGKNPTVTKH